VRELAQGVHSASAGEGQGIRLELDLDPVELGIEQGVPCALILNELLSNAFKYAFAGGRTGRILVSLRQHEPGSCELAVEDDGVGLPEGALGGQSKSLGLRIVGILTNQLEGSVEQQPCTGTRIVLRFPAAA
jgi:two-component sensor histidine kinase